MGNRCCLLSTALARRWKQIAENRPEAFRSSRVFISSDAHCSKLSVRRPLYLERNSWVVPFSIILVIAYADGHILTLHRLCARS